MKKSKKKIKRVKNSCLKKVRGGVNGDRHKTGSITSVQAVYVTSQDK